MTAGELVDLARNAGVAVICSEGCLRLRTLRPVRQDVLDDLGFLARRHRRELVELVAGSEVEWRVRAMLPQVPPTGPVGLLVARDGAWSTDGRCLSCGDAIEAGARCDPCSTAAAMAIELARG